LADADIILDEEFRQLIPPRTAAERAALEAAILAAGVCRDPLVLWKGYGILLDGHGRLEICWAHGIPFTTVELEFPDRAAAADWILAQQTEQRNLDARGVSYTRGKRYLLARHGHGGHRRTPNGRAGQLSRSNGQAGSSGPNPSLNGSSGQSDHLKTEERLGREYGVAPRTIRWDADYATAVDAIVASCGEWAKSLLVSPDAKATRQDALKLAAMGPADQRRLMDDLRQERPLPWKQRAPQEFMRVPLETEAMVQAILKRVGPERFEEIRVRMCEVANGPNGW
jgi:hypothetical protein